MSISIGNNNIITNSNIDDQFFDCVVENFCTEYKRTRVSPSTRFKRYKKAQNNYKKQLIKLAKSETPATPESMLDVIELMIKRRLEYFSLGDFVYLKEKTRLKLVTELQDCLNLFLYARETNTQESYEDAFKYFASHIQNWWG